VRRYRRHDDLRGYSKDQPVSAGVHSVLSVIFIVCGMWVILVHRDRIGGVFCRIFAEAFSVRSLSSGLGGYAFFARCATVPPAGILQRSGNGHSPIVHAASGNDPVRQGIAGRLKFFLTPLLWRASPRSSS
jgi:AGCS family alanine or glycine:cation symporter